MLVYVFPGKICATNYKVFRRSKIDQSGSVVITDVGKPSGLIVGLKLFSFPTFALKSPTTIFTQCNGKLSYNASRSS